jgi:hypothetical protein
MPNLLTQGALLQCSFGVAPSSLSVLPQNKVMAVGKPAANIMDNKPMVNIMPFGMCQSLANPQVAAATAAALGVLTPMPCIPNTTAPWTPGKPVTMIGNQPIINDTSKLMCMWAGVIQVSFAGQVTVQA